VQQDGTVVYVGKSKDLRGRISQHWSVRSELRFGKWSVRIYECSVDEIGEIERACIAYYQPYANTALKNVKHGECPPSLSRMPPFVLPESGARKQAHPHIGDLLQCWRKSHKYHVDEAAEIVGVSLESYAALEGGNEVKSVMLFEFLTWMMQDFD